MTKGTGLPGGSQDLKPDLTSRLCVFPSDELLLLFSCSVVSDSFAIAWTVPLTGPSVHGISQVRVLEWAVISSSRGSSRPRD